LLRLPTLLPIAAPARPPAAAPSHWFWVTIGRPYGSVAHPSVAPDPSKLIASNPAAARFDRMCRALRLGANRIDASESMPANRCQRDRWAWSPAAGTGVGA